MLSRVAENVYWMARYVERAESIARVMDVNNHLALDMPESEPDQWLPLIAIMSDEEPFFKKHKIADRDAVIHFMACDADNSNSIVSCLKSARENARSIRELIPSDAWVHLNTLYLKVSAAAEQGVYAFTPDALNDIRLGSHLFFGLLSDIMTRDEGYYFAQLGRFIERADKTSRVIDVKYFLLLPSPSDVGSPLDTIQWAAMLKSVSAYEMFHKRNPSIHPPRVVDFLLRDDSFHRFCTVSTRSAAYWTALRLRRNKRPRSTWTSWRRTSRARARKRSSCEGCMNRWTRCKQR